MPQDCRQILLEYLAPRDPGDPSTYQRSLIHVVWDNSVGVRRFHVHGVFQEDFYVREDNEPPIRIRFADVVHCQQAGNHILQVELREKATPLSIQSDRSRELSDSAQVQAALEKLSEKLLDMTLRNRALNFRLRKAQGVSITDANLSEVFRLLVQDKESLTFHATQPEDDEDADELTVPVAAYAEHKEEALEPTVLKAPYKPSILNKRLLGSYRATRLFLQEQGFSPLYLAFGMLNWFESPASEVKLQAPLLLVPVTLTRANVRSGFKIKLANDELLVNLSLQEKLKRDFSIDEKDFPEPQEPTVYFDRFEELVREQPRWRLDRSALVLDTISFSRLVMYHDLAASSWPRGHAPSEHPIIRSLLGRNGFRNSTSQHDDNAFLDTIVTPEDLPLVVEADSSQLLALLEAENAQQLVIQGPPGTGKSQTITNLIAMALARNKKVLFVAEKMAALEVVKRNLNQIELGNVYLELHSYKTNKKQFLEELRQTLDLREVPVARASAQAAQLHLIKEKRERLNAYANAVNTPVRSSGLTPHQLYGELLQIQSRTSIPMSSLPRFEVMGMLDWDGPTWQRKREYVLQLQKWCHEHGLPSKHPLWGTKKRAALPNTVTQIRSACEAALEATREVVGLATEVATHIGVSAATSRHEVSLLVNAARVLAKAPDIKGLTLADPIWGEHGDVLLQIVKDEAFCNQTKQRFAETLLSYAWQADVEVAKRDLDRYGRRFWRFLSGRYRRASRLVADLCRDEPPRSLEERLTLLQAIMEVQQAKRYLNEHEHIASAAWGKTWRQQWRDLEALEKATAWLVDVHKQFRERALPSDFLEVVKPHTCQVSPETSNKLLTALENQARQIADVTKLLELDEARRFPNASFATVSFEVQRSILEAWQIHADKLPAMVQFNHLADRLVEEGLARVLEVALCWDAAGQNLVTAFEHDWYNKLLEDAFNERPALAQFNGSTHEQLVNDFRELDRLTYAQKQLELQQKHRNDLPMASSDSALVALKQQMRRRRGHMPIRKLMEQSGEVIQRIKPVFMMSPLSVATFLPPGRVGFDVVIFDEASQVRPEEALGAICRGKQVIVVGDSKQLPPTTFFDSTAQEDDDGDDPTDPMLLESILDGFEVKGAPQKMLRWHYRSQHESLIAISNEEFYTPPGLLVFPSASKDGLGLVFHHHPETVYQGNGKNPKEARLVAKAVREHFVKYPHESLGVAAFSQPQMTAIEDELERLRLEDPTFERFFRNNRREPFFVKNLETIQGDERDVIFISVGYGRDRDGRISMNFGPVNQAGGERRLNVLMTRARKRCEIFTNLSSNDIRSTGSRGVEVLKRFLHYAETGKLASLPLHHGGFDSPFEEAVYQELSKLGYQVHSQIGVAGYFIDLAIVDPDQPGRYLLGIECDGANYHSARSARDRDRLRQIVLEQHRGWCIHRIWSTDWFMNPQVQLERLVEAIERCKTKRGAAFAFDLPTGDAGTGDAFDSASDGQVDYELSDEIEEEDALTDDSSETATTDSRLNRDVQPGLSSHAKSSFKASESESGEPTLDAQQWRAVELGAETFFRLSRWAKENQKFNPRSRRFLYQMGQMIARGFAPTPKQANWLLDLYHQAVELGFKSEGE